MTIDKFAKKHNLKLQLTKTPFRVGANSDWDAQASHYMYKITATEGDLYNKPAITGYYSQGSAIKTQPTIADILNALILDTNSVGITSFEDWASEFGYNTDSRKAFDIYHECMKEYEQLKTFFGSLLDELYSCETL